jgi:peptide chain release factor subunit 1
LKERVIGVVDTSYTGEPGLREIVERAEEILSEASVTKERKVLERFFEELGKDSGLAVYGLKETVEATEAGNLEIMIISEDFDWVRFGFECPACGEKFSKVLDRKQSGKQKCKCGKKPDIVSEKELTEEIVESAEKIGTTVYIVSSSTGMGEQLKELGGIVGILRYRQ